MTMDNKIHEYVRPCKVRDLTFKIKRYWDEGPPMSFSDLGWSYEEKRRFRYMLQDYMHSFFRFDDHNGKLVLDLGCGAGIDSLEFARYGAHVISVDFSESSIALTKLLYVEAGLYHIGHVVLCDARHLPFRDRCVDVVYSFGVIHHIPEAETVINECWRVLKDGGKFMGMVYNRDSLMYAYSILYLQGIKRGLLKEVGLEELENMTERRAGNPYTKLYTKEELYSLLKERFGAIEIAVKYDVIDTEHKRKVKVAVPPGIEVGWHLVFKCVK